MSFRKKRKISAPGRLDSPFVSNDLGKQVNAVDDNPPVVVQSGFFSRRISYYSSEKRNCEQNVIAEVPSDEDTEVFLDNLVEHVDNSHVQPPPPHIVVSDDDEGYISPQPSSSGSKQLAEQNAGELTLIFLFSLFVEEADRKIDKFIKSVSADSKPNSSSVVYVHRTITYCIFCHSKRGKNIQLISNTYFKYFVITEKLNFSYIDNMFIVLIQCKTNSKIKNSK